MNTADVARPENVREVCGYCGEPAPVHGEDDHGGRVEIHQPDHRGVDADLLGGIGDGTIQQDAQRKEDPVGIAPPDVIRRAGPDKPPYHVEYADHDDVGGGKRPVYDMRQGCAEDLGHHGLGHAQHADTRGDVETEHDPQLVELPRLQGLIDVHVVAGHHPLLRVRLVRGSPALRLPARGGQPVGECRDHHDDEINHAHGEERLGDTDRAGAHQVNALRSRNHHLRHLVGADDDHFAQFSADFREAPACPGNQVELGYRPQVFRRPVEILDKILLQGRADHGAAAETHDRHARGHAAPVREPADQCADR